jgi:hypothetical protein
MVRIEKLTTSLQFIGAALAVPAGAAGVYSAYHNYFSPEVICQEMRNSTLVTLEKNIPSEAKLALMRKEVTQFETKCGEVEPETNTIFQAALHELEQPATRRVASRAPQPASVQTPGAAAALVAPAAAPSAPAGASPGAVAPARQAAAPTASAAPAAQGAGPALGNGISNGLGRIVHGWVAIELRKGDKVTEAFFSGYAANGQALPGPGTVLTAMALRPIWSQPQGPGPNDPTQLAGRIKVGECVRVVGTRASPGRQWAEVEPTLCQ